jgi:hypothetical protein
VRNIKLPSRRVFYILSFSLLSFSFFTLLWTLFAFVLPVDKTDLLLTLLHGQVVSNIRPVMAVESVFPSFLGLTDPLIGPTCY